MRRLVPETVLPVECEDPPLGPEILPSRASLWTGLRREVRRRALHLGPPITWHVKKPVLDVLQRVLGTRHGDSPATGFPQGHVAKRQKLVARRMTPESLALMQG